MDPTVFSPAFQKRLQLLAKQHNKDPTRAWPADAVRPCVDLLKMLTGDELTSFMEFLRNTHAGLYKATMFGVISDLLELQLESPDDDYTNVILVLEKYLRQETDPSYWICTPSLCQAKLRTACQ